MKQLLALIRNDYTVEPVLTKKKYCKRYNAAQSKYHSKQVYSTSFW